MAVPGIKYDDGTGGFASNCFPVRCFAQEEDADGKYMTAVSFLFFSNVILYLRMSHYHVHPTRTCRLKPMKAHLPKQNKVCKGLGGAYFDMAYKKPTIGSFFSRYYTFFHVF